METHIQENFIPFAKKFHLILFHPIAIPLGVRAHARSDGVSAVEVTNFSFCHCQNGFAELFI